MDLDFREVLLDAQRLAGTLVLRTVHVLRAASGPAGVPGASGEGRGGVVRCTRSARRPTAPT